MSSTQSESLHSNRADETQRTVHSSDADFSTASHEIKTTVNRSSSFNSSVTNSNIENKLTSTVHGKAASSLSCSISPIRHESKLTNVAGGLASIDEESSPEDTLLQQDLFKWIFSAQINDIAKNAKEWIQNFDNKDSQKEACKQFMYLFLCCAGYVQPDLPVNFTDNALRRFIAQIDKDKHKKYKVDIGLFPSNSCVQQKAVIVFREFVMHIIVASSKQPMFRTKLLPFLLNFLKFRKSSFSQNRHTCAHLVLSIVEGLIITYNYLLTRYDSLEARKEQEEEKDESVQSIDILTQVACKIEEVCEHIEYFEKQLNFVLEQGFVDFTRDQDEKIIHLCLQYLRRWVCEYDQLFLTPSYLRLITRCFFHPDSEVRIECIQCMNDIFDAKNKNKLVQDLYNTVKEKILRLTNDQNFVVAKCAIKSITKAYMVWEDLVPIHHVQKIYELVYCPFPLLSHTAGKLLWYIIQSMAEDSIDVLVHLVEFHNESKENDKMHLLVDAVYPLDSDGVLVMWKNMLSILLQSETQEKYNLTQEDVEVMAKITVHLIRKAITGESEFLSETQPPDEGTTESMLENQLQVTTLFLPKLPILMQTFQHNIDVMIEIVSIPQYFVESEFNHQLTEGYLKELLQELISIVNNTTNDTLLFQCFRSLEILSDNQIFKHITKPQVESILSDCIGDCASCLEQFLKKLKSELSNNGYALTESDIQDMNINLRRLNALGEFHDFTEEHQTNIWKFVIDVLSCFNDVNYTNFWQLNETVTQIPIYCIRIGVQMVLHDIEDIDEYESGEQQNIDMYGLFGQLFTVVQNSTIFKAKIHAFEGIMQLTVIVKGWNKLVYSQEEDVVLKFLHYYIFVKPDYSSSDIDEDELKEQEKLKRMIVEKLCHLISTNTVLPSIVSLVYSKQLEFEEEYGEVFELTFKDHMDKLDRLDQADEQETEKYKFLVTLLEGKFNSIDSSNEKSVGIFENLAHKWSTCIPSQRISSKCMLAIQVEGIDFAFRTSRRGLEFLKGLRHFLIFLNDEHKRHLIKVLGEKTMEVNKYKKQDRECFYLYKSMLEIPSRRPTKNKLKKMSQEAQDLPDDDNNEESRPSILDSQDTSDIESNVNNDDQSDRSSHLSSSSSKLSSFVKRKNASDSDESGATETIKYQQKKQKLNSDRKQALDDEWKSSSDESQRTPLSLRTSTRSKNKTPLSTIDENSIASQLRTSKVSSDNDNVLDSPHSVLSIHMTRSKTHSLSSQSSMSLSESELPYRVTTRRKKR